MDGRRLQDLAGINEAVVGRESEGKNPVVIDTDSTMRGFIASLKLRVGMKLIGVEDDIANDRVILYFE